MRHSIKRSDENEISRLVQLSGGDASGVYLGEDSDDADADADANASRFSPSATLSLSPLLQQLLAFFSSRFVCHYSASALLDNVRVL